MFEGIIGQEKALKILEDAIHKERVAHAYLFYGPKGTGKYTVAAIFAKAIFCLSEGEKPCGVCPNCRKIAHNNFADLHFIYPSGASLKIEQFRRIKVELETAAVEGGRRVCIISEAEKMTLVAANSLLKILEEPNPYVHFLLLTDNLYGVLPTIVSRCQLVPFMPIDRRMIEDYLTLNLGKDREEARVISLLAGGSMEKGIVLSENPEVLKLRDIAFGIWQGLDSSFSLWQLSKIFEEQKDYVDELFDIILWLYRDLLIYNQTGDTKLIVNLDWAEEIVKKSGNYTWHRIQDKINCIEETRRYLQQNVNFRMAVENMLLQIAK